MTGTLDASSEAREASLLDTYSTPHASTRRELERTSSLSPPDLVKETRASRAGYERRFRFAGPCAQAYVQEVHTRIEFRAGERALVTYEGAYRELLWGQGLDRHALAVWREGWDQRGIRALLEEHLEDPTPALEALQEGAPLLVAHKRFRVALAPSPEGRITEGSPPAGYLEGAEPASLTLYHPLAPRVLRPRAYPADACTLREPQAFRPGPWTWEANERFSYHFATCAAALQATPYSALPPDPGGDPCPIAR